MNHIPNFWLDNNTTDKVNRHTCCGCSACESACAKQAIKMQADQEGFLYPVMDESLCVDCGLCTKVCPVANKCENDAPYVKSYGGYSTDQKVIDSCASGGIATALSIETIRKGGVVFGVRFNEAYNASEYCVVRTEDELWSLCSSKYIQPSKSGIHKMVKEELVKGIPVLFVGCPCDVAALHRYLRKDYDNLLTCELFCASITSPKILQAYKDYREQLKKSSMKSLNMRNKEHGWFVSNIKEEYNDGSVFYKNYYATYMGHAFLTFRRPSCYHCQYKQNTTYCDIKVGDFWGIKPSDPFWNPQGVSVILAKTEKGDKVLNELKDFKLYKIDHKRATVNNHGFMQTPGEALEVKREKFARIFIEEDKGLVAACKATASKSFWVKYYVPTSFHTVMKKVFHFFKDK